MATGGTLSPSDQNEILKRILSTVQSIREDYHHLSAAVKCIQGQLNVLSGISQVDENQGRGHLAQTHIVPGDERAPSDTEPGPNARLEFGSAEPNEARNDGEFLYERKNNTTATSRIILTTYPGQSGIDPLAMNWGHADVLERGPVVVSRSQSTVRRRNGK